MGNCLSGAPAHLIEQNDGGEKEFHEKYVEEQVLGEGEFGQVKLVHEVGKEGKREMSTTPYACKTLRKGAVFKNNTLYSPIKPEILQGEIEILRKLSGKHYCLHLESIFETPRTLLVVTEYCGGGEMMEYVANRKEDLRTEDVSRIAFQLFDAVNHCAKNGVIHRDIKPENCMFQDPTPNAELRLIDFGSGTIGSPYSGQGEPEQHTTFAGSAFYISPEMFQHTYTFKTDVWSAGAALYVLVAGYPGDQLQKAFNTMQSSKDRDLKSLPNLPDEMPETYYEMLEKTLTYRHKSRPTAEEVLKTDFAQFHIEHAEGISLDEVAAAAASSAVPASPGGTGTRRTTSISLKGSVNRHNLFLGFKSYERSLTALLVSLMSKKELQQLVEILKEHVDKRKANENSEAVKLIAQETREEHLEELDGLSQEKQLSVIQVRELKSIIRNDLGNHQALAAMDKLPGGNAYDGFAYHIYLLKDFSRDDEGITMGSGGRRMSREGSFRQGSFRSDNGSVRSTGMRGSGRGSVGRGMSFRAMSMRKPKSTPEKLETTTTSSQS